MAFARSSGTALGGGAAGFMYISASHNPIGYNGIKFGLTDGGLLPPDESAKLALAFRSFLASMREPPPPEKAEQEAAESRARAVYAAADGWKRAALEAYRDFSGEVISGFGDRGAREEFFAVLRKGVAQRPLTVAADFNGSARTLSIDRDFFASLGVGFFAINDAPGEIAHRIVPEGESLEPCREFLEELRRKDPSAIAGYLPDCDGDRGNLVIMDCGDDAPPRARMLEAQEVFALACVAELSALVWAGELGGGRKAAIAANDPTSLRIDRIARAFGVQVFRAEVGEANVVGLARRLRQQGYLVRILGEGSAGGTIIHPSAVRDPLATLGAMLKILAVREKGNTGMGIFEIWLNASGQGETYREDFTLADIIASLPAFATTGAYASEAQLKVQTADHSLLKERYQKIFLKEWEDKKDMLKNRYGISGWEAIAYNGMEEKRGISQFAAAGQGGLKIEFSGLDPHQECAIASVWMRGSATEPVFRVMADAADLGRADSGLTLERALIEWQRQMVLQADTECVI